MTLNIKYATLKDRIIPLGVTNLGDTTLLENTNPLPSHPYREGSPPSGGRRREIPERWMFVVALNLRGYTHSEISELSGYTSATISRILSHEHAVQLRQQLMSGLDAELQMMYPQIIHTIREALTHSDMKFRLDGVEKWNKMVGKYKEGSQNVSITAEDVVVNMLNVDR